MLEMAKRSVGVVAACLPLWVISADVTVAATEQDIQDASLERMTLSAQRLMELNLNRDGRVDVADAALNQIGEGILPKAEMWVVILTPTGDAAHAENRPVVDLLPASKHSRSAKHTQKNGIGILAQVPQPRAAEASARLVIIPHL